jgi:hypothetical protein
MNKQKTTKIHFGEIARQFDQSIKSADQLRTESLKGLERVRKARQNSSVRELGRLRAKLGVNHPRVIALTERRLRDAEFIRDIDFGIKRASDQIEKVAENTWIVHGRVYSAEIAVKVGLLVAVQDEEGQAVIGPVRSDKTGFFKLVYKRKKRGDDKTPRGDLPLETKLFLHVSDRDGTPLHRDPRPFRVQLGAAEYREIIMIDDDYPSRRGEKVTTEKKPANAKKKTKEKKKPDKD